MFLWKCSLVYTHCTFGGTDLTLEKSCLNRGAIIVFIFMLHWDKAFIWTPWHFEKISVWPETWYQAPTSLLKELRYGNLVISIVMSMQKHLCSHQRTEMITWNFHCTVLLYWQIVWYWFIYFSGPSIYGEPHREQSSPLQYCRFSRCHFSFGNGHFPRYGIPVWNSWLPCRGKLLFPYSPYFCLMSFILWISFCIKWIVKLYCHIYI